jgi:hypothetical protein
MGTTLPGLLLQAHMVTLYTPYMWTTLPGHLLTVPYFYNPYTRYFYSNEELGQIASSAALYPSTWLLRKSYCKGVQECV